MRQGGTIRLMTLLLAALLCLSFFPAPALADEYNELYPENLAEGHLTAAAAIVMEADTGRVIFEKNADLKMYPASTTKIMTVYLALVMAESLEGGSYREKIETKFTVSENATNLAPDESSAKFATGENVRLIDLCYAAMLVSGNDAATAIAEGLRGSVYDFAQEMNTAAARMGCVNTHFVNANGLHDEDHYTTARDLATMSRIAMQHDTFRTIVRTVEYSLPRDNIYRERTITNGNNFVAESSDANKKSRYYPDATGIKTGTTSAAGNCLVASATRDGVSLITVVLGATSDASRYEDSKKLMNYGFSQFISTSISEIYLMNPRIIDIRGFDLNDPEVGRLKLDIRLQSTEISDAVVLTREEQETWAQNLYSMTVTEFTRELSAPITQGDIIGTLTYYDSTGQELIYDLLASRSIAARTQLYPSIKQITADAENDPNPFPRITLELVIVYLILPVTAIFIVVKLLKALGRLLRKRRRVNTYKPTSRHYR